MSRLYFYKLTTNNNGAPCVADGLLTLAICKPTIRKTASVGDVLIGFAGSTLHRDNRLIYVGRVTEKLVDGDYFKDGRFGQRPDCIYAWRNNRFVVRADARYHGSPEGLVHDLGLSPGYLRANTLLSREFRYFGADGSDAYKGNFSRVAKAVSVLARGHRVNHGDALHRELEALVEWSLVLDDSSVPAKHRGKPRDYTGSEADEIGMKKRGGCGCC
jgi:hypothetical protein